MSTEEEHDIIPAIRDWLAATSGVDISLGISRKEAQAVAEKLLADLAAGLVPPDPTQVEDDLRDVLLAAVELLEEKALSRGRQIFDVCDRLYRYASELSFEADPFDERDEILHRIAKVGWRSAPRDLAASLRNREETWTHGDVAQHRDLCASADRIPSRIETLLGRPPELSELREICGRLLKLASIRPRLVASSLPPLHAYVHGRKGLIGHLDDGEHLEAVICFTACLAGRQLGDWGTAESRRRQAESAFSRTVHRSDLDRVATEHLALLAVRGRNQAACNLASDLIKRARIPRERVRARLILAAVQLNLGRPAEARLLLESTLPVPATDTEPALKSWLLIKLGTAFSYLDNDSRAMEAFEEAGEILASFHYPLQSADLTGSVGEHLAKLGKLEKAIVLYDSARQIYHEMGHGQLVGYYNILIAELLMMLGRSDEAEKELILAIPLIEKFDLRREALAAVVLLREGLAKRCTDVTTLRSVRNQLRKGSS